MGRNRQLQWSFESGARVSAFLLSFDTGCDGGGGGGGEQVVHSYLLFYVIFRHVYPEASGMGLGSHDKI